MCKECLCNVKLFKKITTHSSVRKQHYKKQYGFQHIILKFINIHIRSEKRLNYLEDKYMTDSSVTSDENGKEIKRKENGKVIYKTEIMKNKFPEIKKYYYFTYENANTLDTLCIIFLLFRMCCRLLFLREKIIIADHTTEGDELYLNESILRFYVGKIKHNPPKSQ